MSPNRQYDIVIFGATGYTGELTAEYITMNLPNDLRWALAGRSRSKLEAVLAECKALNADRIQPVIEVCGLNDNDLTALAKKTQLLISGVGPYSLYGEAAFKACANSGTHYFDVTGETVFVADMIKKYEATAKANGSIMISQIGVESTLSDVTTWSLVNMIRDRLSAPTAEVVLAVQEMSISKSGGTLATPFAVMEAYSIKQILAAGKPYALSPIPGPTIPDTTSWFTKIFGVRTVPNLGTLTTSSFSKIDTPIVQRSWGLLGYGPNFRFGEYKIVENTFLGVVNHFALLLLPLLFLLPGASSIAKRFLTPPGKGPSKEQGAKDRIVAQGIATPDVSTPNPPRVFCQGSYEGSPYALTAAILGEAAQMILYDGIKLPGGIYTPACLGQNFVTRLESAGYKLEKKFLEY